MTEGGCLMVVDVYRGLYGDIPIGRLTNRFGAGNIRNELSSLNMTAFHCSMVQSRYLLQKAKRLLLHPGCQERLCSSSADGRLKMFAIHLSMIPATALLFHQLL